MPNYVTFVEKESWNSILKVQIFETFEITVITQENIEAKHSICYLKCNAPNRILLVFHNCSNYNYRFIVKELANEFQGKFWVSWGKHCKA